MLLFIRMKPNLKYIGMIKQKATCDIPNLFLKVTINTITWIWTKSLIIHTVTFRGTVNVEKIYCHFFSCDFFSTDATHTYDIILNTDTISILIPYSQ